MTALWIVLTSVVLLIAVVYIVISFSLFNFAIVRKDRDTTFTPEALTELGAGEYTDEIINAQNELDNEGLEIVEATSFDGLKLKAFLYRAPEPKGTIILFHGYRSAPSCDFCIAKKFYAEQGLNVLMPYERAHGMSEGQYITFGIKERFDVHTWTDIINNSFGYQLPLFLSGLSMGSATVLMSTERDYPDNVKLIIADCGFTSPIDIFEHVVKTTMKIPFKLFIPVFGLLCKKKAGFDVNELSTVDALKNCKIPVFFIHGEADTYVPMEMTLRSYEACASEKYLHTVPEAQHALSFVVDSGEYKATIRRLISRFIE